MVQGSLKKAKANTASTKRPSALGPKRGPRAIAPKKASLIKQQKITKKLSAGLTAKTEKNLAEKAGHLELLAGGKKDKKKVDKGNKLKK
ncbi:hypothetical protein EYZ11_011418 [Aspergillus tanneri]|uniref:Uncharacterized protein n=1 Tax=Aspergillus tanneri TaxID=1220188 RepID=A0A4S3J517_9EURO|nr:uncharacterized protein ATNIH1004_004481 [Aspergillus tanneri]KAA8648596.1 hypothetical protein ATNIH1004_004481 [Aspergillus tanneri]THC89138.1 hypothetical protein EYZ11_011418 [Aspergillus tanneri]